MRKVVQIIIQLQHHARIYHKGEIFRVYVHNIRQIPAGKNCIGFLVRISPYVNGKPLCFEKISQITRNSPAGQIRVKGIQGNGNRVPAVLTFKCRQIKAYSAVLCRFFRSRCLRGRFFVPCLAWLFLRRSRCTASAAGKRPYHQCTGQRQRSHSLPISVFHTFPPDKIIVFSF